MKVLVISATFPPMRSGGADYAFRLCQHLAESGVDVHVLTSRIENVATDPRIRVSPLMPQWSWREMPRLLHIAHRVRPDVVNLHFTGWIYNHPMITFIPALLKRLLPKLRIVTHIEFPIGIDKPLSLRGRAARKLIMSYVGARDVNYEYGTILRDSDRLIILSDTHRLTLSKYHTGMDDKCVLIPPPPIMPMCMEANGAARQRGREMLSVAPDEFLIAYFGYIYPHKGIETLLEAFHLIAQQREKIRLVLVGGSNEVVLKEVNRPHYAQELQDLSARLGVADKVIWTGYYSTDSDYASLCLRSADACALPFNNGVYLNNSSFTAAAAHGLPIVTTKGEMIEPPLIDQKNVLLCPPKDSSAFAAAIDSLISRPEMRQQLSMGALNLAHEWFSWDKAVRRTIEVFRGGT